MHTGGRCEAPLAVRREGIVSNGSLAGRIDRVERRMDSVEERFDASFPALSAQIVQSNRETRDEILANMRAGFADQSGELRGTVAALRDGLRGETTAMGEGLRAEMAGMREDLRGEGVHFLAQGRPRRSPEPHRPAGRRQILRPSEPQAARPARTRRQSAAILNGASHQRRREKARRCERHLGQRAMTRTMTPAAFR